MYRENRVMEEERKDYRVTIQVSAREKKILKMLANQEGLNVSDYIRRISLYLPYNKMFSEVDEL